MKMVMKTRMVKMKMMRYELQINCRGLRYMFIGVLILIMGLVLLNELLYLLIIM